MRYVFCNACGHRNPPTSAFCSACGAVLDLPAHRTIQLAATDPGLDAAGPADNPEVDLGAAADRGVLVERTGDRAGRQHPLGPEATRIGRHPGSEIVLDDISVSRVHAEVRRGPEGLVVTDLGSLNGTYVNQRRVDAAVLRHGDELQVGRFRMILFSRVDAGSGAR